MLSNSRTRIVKAVAGACALAMVAIFVLFVFQAINPWIFWIAAGSIAVLAFVILPRIRKISE